MEKESHNNKYHVAVFQNDSVVEHLLMGVIFKFGKAIKYLYIGALYSCST